MTWPDDHPLRERKVLKLILWPYLTVPHQFSHGETEKIAILLNTDSQSQVGMLLITSRSGEGSDNDNKKQWHKVKLW